MTIQSEFNFEAAKAKRPAEVCLFPAAARVGRIREDALAIWKRAPAKRPWHVRERTEIFRLSVLKSVGYDTSRDKEISAQAESFRERLIAEINRLDMLEYLYGSEAAS